MGDTKSCISSLMIWSVCRVVNIRQNIRMPTPQNSPVIMCPCTGRVDKLIITLSRSGLPLKLYTVVRCDVS